MRLPLSVLLPKKKSDQAQLMGLAQSALTLLKRLCRKECPEQFDACYVTL